MKMIRRTYRPQLSVASPFQIGWNIRIKLSLTNDKMIVFVATPPKKCGVGCPRNYRPICDNTGHTHSNGCLFNNAKCRNPKLKIAHNGKCKKGKPKLFSLCHTKVQF